MNQTKSRWFHWGFWTSWAGKLAAARVRILARNKKDVLLRFWKMVSVARFCRKPWWMLGNSGTCNSRKPLPPLCLGSGGYWHYQSLVRAAAREGGCPTGARSTEERGHCQNCANTRREWQEENPTSTLQPPEIPTLAKPNCKPEGKGPWEIQFIEANLLEPRARQRRDLAGLPPHLIKWGCLHLYANAFSFFSFWPDWLCSVDLSLSTLSPCL